MRLLWKNYIYEAVSINKEYLLKLANGDFARFQEAKAKAAKIVKDTNMNPPEKDSIKIQALLTKFILQNQLPNSVGSFIHDIINENKLNILFKLNSDSTKEDFQNLIDEYNSSRMSNSGEKLSSDESCVWLRTKIHHDFGDGYKWVIALDGAGKPIGYIPSTITQKTMKHCGNEPSHAPGDVYYGLRDANNKEIVTVIVDSDSKIKESKGYNNQPPRNKEIINKYMQWLIMHPDIKGVSYDNGYARHMNYGVSQMSDDDEFISKIEKEKPSMVHPEVDAPILQWKRDIKSGKQTEQDLIDEYIQGKVDEYENPLMLEHVIGILGKNPFSEKELINMIIDDHVTAAEIGNAGTQYLTIPIQHAFVDKREYGDFNIKALIEIYNQVPNSKIDIVYILNHDVDNALRIDVANGKRLEAVNKWIVNPGAEITNIQNMFWVVYNPGARKVSEIEIQQTAAVDALLIKYGKIDVNRKTSNGNVMAFNICAFPPILEVFLKNGLNPNITDDRNGTLLSFLVGHYDISEIYTNENIVESFKMLLNAGADPNLDIGFSMLFYAHGEILDILLDHPGINVNVRDNRGDNILTRAIRDDNTNISRILIKRDLLVNSYGYKNETPLMVAVKKENLTIVNMLLEKGAKVEAIGDGGVTAMKLADKLEPSLMKRNIINALEEYSEEED